MDQKIYPNLIASLMEILEDIIVQGAFADKALERSFKSHTKWGARDRNFIATNVYGIIRYKRLLEALTDDVPSEHHLPAIFKAYWWHLHGQVPKLPELPEISGATLTSKMHKIRQKVAILESFPDWMVAEFSKDYPDEYPRLMKSLNEEAEVILRVNRLKTEKAPLLKQLTSEGIQVSAIDEDSDALKLSKRANVFRTEAFKKGYFEVQDRSSQAVGPFLDIQPGMQIIDACAGAGGKSLHLAALSKGKGRILSLDTEPYKLAELKKRAKRAGAGNIETRIIESSKTIKRLKDKADRLLLDVPCTGTGVIRRNPDSKWKIDPAFLEQITQTQAHILDTYSKMVKPGGKMVYATCSVLSVENEDQTARFLIAHPEFQLEEVRKYIPHIDGYDGFYMARFVKSKNAGTPKETAESAENQEEKETPS